MSVKTYIDECASAVERIQNFKMANMQSYGDFDLIRNLFLLLTNADLLVDDPAMQESVAREAKELINYVYDQGQAHTFTVLAPNGDVLALKAYRDAATSVLNTVTADGTLQELVTVNAGPFSPQVPPVEFGDLNRVMLFVDEQAEKKYTSVTNILYQLDIKQQLTEVVDVVLDLSLKGETKASDVYAIVTGRFKNLYSTSEDFVSGIIENASFLDRNTVLPFLEGLLNSISGARVSDDGTNITLEDTNYSNKAWLGTVLKQAVASLAVVVSSAIAYVVSPVLGAIVAGVGTALSFITTKVKETASPRIHWDAPLYDYAMTLFTTSVENELIYRSFGEAYRSSGLALHSIGNVYILTTPVFNRNREAKYLRYQCSLNLAYKPYIAFEVGTSVGPNRFKSAHSHLVSVNVTDGVNSTTSISCKGWDATYKDDANYNHADHYSPSRLITQASINDDQILTDLAAALSESLSVLTGRSLANKVVTLSTHPFVYKDFSELTTDLDLAIAWMGYLATYASAPDHTVDVVGGPSGTDRHTMDLTWSDINDTIIPLIRSLANDLSVPCSSFILNQQIRPIPMDPAQVLRDDGFVEPPVFSKEQWIKTGLLIAAGAAVAAVVAVGAVKATRAITQVRIKRYVKVQNAMQRYSTTGSTEDLKAYTKAARKYNFLTKFLGGNKVDMLTGWESDDKGSSIVSDVTDAFADIQDRLNESGDTVSTDTQTNALLLKIKNLISAE